ncbi:hypothetical protein Poli38472_000757 [Pythium oligandrum]|uniref:GB1/RHD3-type G domain-containing protein n=1 Tax=Pythium oligandrum TaxID=41045 RepID=A0A8K1CCQ0_PYTOL|nr:hypothetical protein Poli38472_000757 [Pythium oligandrum]|eukprot:TMW60715.1 hypothetical protein Poli38472_000757 [Pythium oligandrum]
MDNLKSMIFGTKPSAVKWLGMGHSDADNQDHPDRMFVHPDAAKHVLQPLGDQPINLISIFGAARQGKSFLMNLLAGQQDLFKISNLREPCTQGVDLSSHFIPLPKFSALNNCPAVATRDDPAIQVGFVDAEGQGDRDITYDSRLVSPVLLSSKVVIFNWKDSLQADRILNLLAVLARAAQGIELADGDHSKVFGHLHIIFRDWSFVDSSPEEVYNDLFSKEKGRSEEVNLRNLARMHLVEAFESINIWLFPAPVANTANLRDKIRFEQLQEPFQVKLRDLRKMLSTQLRRPMLFSGKPLTARLLSQMMPVLVETLNSDEVIMPESIYSSMVRAEAKATKEAFERRITEYCEAAGIEDLIASDEFEKMLQHDVQVLIKEAMNDMSGAPGTLRREMQAALEEFAAKEIKLAIHTNNQKIAQRVSHEVDVVFENLRSECLHIEQNDVPMRSDLLKHRCKELLAQELNRLEVLPAGTQGRHSIDVEMNRVRQHASVLFDRLEVTNEKAIQKASAAVNERVKTGKVRMTKDTHETLDKIFGARTPVTVATLQAGLEELYRDLIRELKAYVDEHPFMSADFVEDIEDHKSHLAEELNRRYYLEIRQILSEIGFSAKDDLGKEIGSRLEGKLPLEDDEIKRAIDEAVQQVKVLVAQQLQGWTILKHDIAAKSMEIEKLGDVYAYEYLRRNQDLQKDVSIRQEHQQYEDLKSEVIDEFQRELRQVEFPTSEATIETTFTKTIREMISEFLAIETTSPNFTASALFDKLTNECRPELENQKILNRLASEKNHALQLAEKERAMREQESILARKKEEQIAQLQTYVEKSLGERETESKRLQDQLREEADRARQLRDEVEAMRRRTAEIEAQKQMEMSARETALREEMARREEADEMKRELEELRRRAASMEVERSHLQRQAQEDARMQEESRYLSTELNEMKRRAAALEAQKYQLELQAREEALRRQDAEQAARAAANAAALSARAALEAAADEVSPFRYQHVDSGNKRKFSHVQRDVEMEEAPSVTPSVTSGVRRMTPEAIRRAQRIAAGQRPSGSPPATAAERKKRKVQPNTKAPAGNSGRLSALEEARRAAQADLERRIQERTSNLKSKKK